MQTGARGTQTLSPFPRSRLSTGPERHFPISLSTQLRRLPSQCCACLFRQSKPLQWEHSLAFATDLKALWLLYIRWGNG